MKHQRIVKLISFALAASVVSSLAACGSSNLTKNEAPSPQASGSASPEGSGSLEKIDPMGKYDPPITVTSIRPDLGTNYKYDAGETIDNNVWTKAYQDDLGINIKYNWVVPTEQYAQKFGVSIASNDLPDVFDVNMKDFKQLIDNDAIADLTSFYEQYATPLTKSVIEADGGLVLGTAKFNGKLMAIPETQSMLDNIEMIWIRNDWLKKLNLPVPKTMDELIKTAEAFVTQDPDGNGKADTFGFAINKDAISGALTGWADIAPIFYGHHAYPGGWIKDASGNLVYGTVQPEVKTALAALQDMYSKKLIDPEFGVKDGTKVAESTTAGKIGIEFGAMWNSIWPLNGSKENEKDSGDWIAIPLVSSDDKPALSLVSSPATNYHVVNKNFKHPEALIKMVNEWVENTMGPNANNNKYGTTPEGKEIFKMSMFRVWGPKQNLEIYQTMQTVLQTKDTSKLNASDKTTYDKIVAYQGGDIKSWGTAAIFGPGGSQSILEQIDKNKEWVFNEYYGAPTQTEIDRGATLSKIQNETFLKIIMGKESIDEFDKFVDQWKKLGGDQLTKEVNEWYKSKSQ
ncbi:extracellular solute-binding protein [Cohnella nanjingensis]|uniref:Extracellular solute-binding protein n=1 Tax=Cohnella nanjingensis TaxID=1387779 RepID=A0A7X0RPG2_9BACL|nr:extracellular solute-binding protein [Cohnella nanjingensis]MBB6670111.1 extracellular solute-binding protein [Cohnella nanjingensis]